MIQVTPTIALEESQIEVSFVRASGPGGQNVNKVSSAVVLRYDIALSALPDDVKVRLKALAGNRVTGDGVLVIKGQRHRTQESNRQDALNRLIDLVREAAVPPKRRIATKPTLASKRRRLEAKQQRARIKRLRRITPGAGADL